MSQSRAKKGTLDIERVRNDSFDLMVNVLQYDTDTCQLLPVDLSAYSGGTGKMIVRRTEKSTALLTFHSTGITNTIDLSNLASGVIHVIGDPITLAPNGYLYDLELTSSTGFVQTILGGKFIIVADISY